MRENGLIIFARFLGSGASAMQYQNINHCALKRKRGLHGFSLVELAIVMGIIGVIIGGIWVAAGASRQTQREVQSVQALQLTVDAVRAGYGGFASINGGVEAAVPYLGVGAAGVVGVGAMPATLMRSTQSTCHGVQSTYFDTPWGDTNTVDNCGSFRVCAWGGTNTACGVPNAVSAPAFAVEFTNLDYGSCLKLAESVQPSNPPGLQDVYINSNSAAIGPGTGLPVIASIASHTNATFPVIGCNANSNTNTLDFIYSLRAPSY
jgi:prepilin-type N-terminal cleavage/methylation domain-containing protein